MSDAQVQELLDRFAIMELRARFFRKVDEKDWEGFRACFTDDCTFDLGDGNIIQEVLGIPTVQYGPGDIRVYKEWPTPDERVRLTDLVTAAKAVTHATVRLCG